MKRFAKCAAALAALVVTAAPSAHAEQPAAETYRQIFASGNFYLEYEDDFGKNAIGEENGKRMTRKVYSGSSLAVMLNPLGALFGGGPDKSPDMIYQDGKYYQQIFDLGGKKQMMMVTEAQLYDENLDPKEGWSNVKSSIALPEELAPFAWSDRFRPRSAAVQEPRFVESVKKSDGSKQYDCDVYSSRVITAANTAAGEIIYRMMYENGSLVKVESVVTRDGKEFETNSLKIKKLEPEVPKDAFKVKKNTKVYSAGIGDMDDLLESQPQVEVLNEEAPTKGETAE